jgi:hypothetical protein
MLPKARYLYFYICVYANMVRKRSILILPIPKFLIVALLVAIIFAGVDMQNATANDDQGNDHNLCKDQHFPKCLHHEGPPFILPFP